MAAVEVAATIAAEQGVETTEPCLLSDRQAVIVHLPPAPLVARVGVEPVFGPRMEWQRGAVPLTRYLADAGARVVPPTDLFPPGPYERDGRVLSFWQYAEDDESLPRDPRAAGEELRRIHELALGYVDGELAPFWPAGEAESLLGSPEVHAGLAPDELEIVRAALAGLSLPERPEQPLHGDAHIWNTFRTSEGPLWFDFDEACRGPLEWDAATMIEPIWVFGPREDVQVAYGTAFGDRFRLEELAPFVALRVILIVEWLAVLAHRDERSGDLDRFLAWLRERGVLHG